MAPEQAVGNECVCQQCHRRLWTWRRIVYQLLTGRPPFAGGTTYETIKLLLDTEPRPPRLLNPKVDRDLSTICLKCLEKDRARRYPSALALAEDLEHWLKHEPIQAKPSGFFTHGRESGAAESNDCRVDRVVSRLGRGRGRNRLKADSFDARFRPVSPCCHLKT